MKYFLTARLVSQTGVIIGGFVMPTNMHQLKQTIAVAKEVCPQELFLRQNFINETFGSVENFARFSSILGRQSAAIIAESFNDTKRPTDYRN